MKNKEEAALRMATSETLQELSLKLALFMPTRKLAKIISGISVLFLLQDVDSIEQVIDDTIRKHGSPEDVREKITETFKKMLQGEDGDIAESADADFFDKNEFIEVH